MKEKEERDPEQDIVDSIQSHGGPAP